MVEENGIKENKSLNTSEGHTMVGGETRWFIKESWTGKDNQGITHGKKRLFWTEDVSGTKENWAITGLNSIGHKNDTGIDIFINIGKIL